MEQETWNQISSIALVVSAIICIIAIYFQVKAYKKRKMSEAAKAAMLYTLLRNLDRKFPYPNSVEQAQKMHEDICTMIILKTHFISDDIGKALLNAKRDALHDYLTTSFKNSLK